MTGDCCECTGCGYWRWEDGARACYGIGCSSRCRVGGDREQRRENSRECSRRAKRATEAAADACVVAVSHAMTESITRDVLDHGMHVLAEKPVAMSSSAARDLAGIASAKGLVAMAAVNRRFYPGLTESLDLARLIGPVYCVTVIAPDSAEPRRIYGTQSAFVCDHWLQMNTIHAIDLLRMVGGEPVSVQGFVERRGRTDDMSIVAAMRFDGGALGAFVLPGGINKPWQMQVAGDGFSITAEPLEAVVIRIGDSAPQSMPTCARKSNFKLGLYEQAYAFTEAVRHRTPLAWPCSDLSDHAQTLALIEQVQSGVLEPASCLRS